MQLFILRGMTLALVSSYFFLNGCTPKQNGGSGSPSGAESPRSPQSVDKNPVAPPSGDSFSGTLSRVLKNLLPIQSAHAEELANPYGCTTYNQCESNVNTCVVLDIFEKGLFSSE